MKRERDRHRQGCLAELLGELEVMLAPVCVGDQYSIGVGGDDAGINRQVVVEVRFLGEPAAVTVPLMFAPEASTSKTCVSWIVSPGTIRSPSVQF